MPIQDGTSASTTKWATNAFRIKKLFLKMRYNFGILAIFNSWPYQTMAQYATHFSNLFWIKENGQTIFITLFVTSINVGYHADKNFHSNLNQEDWIKSAKASTVLCIYLELIHEIWLPVWHVANDDLCKCTIEANFNAVNAHVHFTYIILYCLLSAIIRLIMYPLHVFLL